MNFRSDNAGPRRDFPLRLGVSACLLGEEVRYDGQHKHQRFLTAEVGRHVEFVSVCPEMEIGLGAPREPIRLVAEGDDVRLLSVDTERDLTAQMRAYAERRVEQLAKLKLSGFVLKKDSPSCGMERVKVWRGPIAKRDGRGLFAEALMQRFPQLPVEEEGRLNDPPLREHFFERVFAHHRLQAFFASDWTLGELVDFHSREKMLLLAHRPETYRELGRLVAAGKQHSRGDLQAEYQRLFMETLARRASFGRHANVLQHMLGCFRERLSIPQRRDLAGVIDDFRRRISPLAVPATMMRHYAQSLDVRYLARQTYLQPFPKDLKLRNYVMD